MQITRWSALLWLIVVVFAAMSGPSTAQTFQVEQLQVELRPEYDRTEMLVIYQGTLPPETPLPATLTLRVPARVGTPHAVAYDDGSGALFYADYTPLVAGEWLQVTFETPRPNFHLEFYDGLARDGDQRSYIFTWPGDYAVGQLRLLFIPPLGAEQVQTEPALTPVQQETGNLGYGGVFDNLSAGEETRFSLSYRGGAIPLVGTGEQSGEKDSDNTLLIVGGAAAVVLLVIVGALWYTRRPESQPVAAPAPRPRPKQPRSQRRLSSIAPGSPDAVPPSGGHCINCGHALGVDDRFCAHCGTPVKNKANR